MASNMPSFAPDVQDINRRREIAKMLMKQGMQGQGPTEYAGGAAVRQSPLLGIANLLVTALGASKQKSADKDYQQALASALKGVQTTAPQVQNVQQAPAVDAYPDRGGMGTMPPQASLQVSNTPQPQAAPQGGGMPDIDQIAALGQFPELKPYYEALMRQREGRETADYASGLRTKEHAANREFDLKNPLPEKAPSSVAEYNFAKDQGYKGSFDQYQREQRTPIQAPDREVVQIAGPDGRPMYVPRAQAVGKNAYVKESGGGTVTMPDGTVVSSGPNLKPTAIPSEIQARLALGENYSKQAPDIIKAIEQGKSGGIGTALNVGQSGVIASRQKSGVDALIRHLTGAGMSQSEADEYSGRYRFEATDSDGRKVEKVKQLVSELKAIDKSVKEGRGWSPADSYGGVETPAPIASEGAVKAYADPNKEAAYQAWKARQK